MKLSKRASNSNPNVLSTLNDLIHKRVEQGKEVFNFSIGTPDLPPDDHVIKAVQTAAAEVENYKYSLKDSDELVVAVQNWYKRRFSVELAPEEITSVYGTQEGMTHIFLTLCDQGDIVLLPSPLYPVFLTGTNLANAEPVYLPMKKENNYLIDFDEIDPELAKRAKVIVVSYPNNPTTVTAPEEFYGKLINFAKKYDIFVIHDNAYGELIHSDEQGRSFLSFEGAKEVGVEFNSLSKSYNLTGLRISFLLGNKEVVSAFKDFRTQIDYGASYIVQKAAVAALNGSQDILNENRKAYRNRRDLLTKGLREIGWQVENCESTMFVWYSIPDNFNCDLDFCTKLLDLSGVVAVPGSSFGETGQGFVRFALAQPDEVILAAINSIDKSGILK